MVVSEAFLRNAPYVLDGVCRQLSSTWVDLDMENAAHRDANKSPIDFQQELRRLQGGINI